MDNFRLKADEPAAPAPEQPASKPVQAGRFDARAIYEGSNGDATMALYAHLQTLGPAGVIALNLFRASKCSARAKVYRGGNKRGSYRSQAYDRKNYSLQCLCSALQQHGEALGIEWGWKEDLYQSFHKWVLYVELPGHGQVSFHSATPVGSQRFRGQWDGDHNSAQRIIHYTNSLLK